MGISPSCFFCTHFFKKKLKNNFRLYLGQTFKSKYTMSDQELWRQLQTGNHNALEKIYRAHFSYLYNYGRRFSSDEATVEDAIQDLFVEIWNNRSKLSTTDAIRPYLLVALRRKLFRANKKNIKNTGIELEEKHFDVVLAIDQIMVNNEMDAAKKNQLKIAFEQLSSRQKEVLYLKYYADMDYNAISEAMGLNYQSSRNLVFRALQKLAKLMTFVLVFLALSTLRLIFSG